MKVIRGFKYRIYPTQEQKKFFEQHFSCVRFVYNYFLNLRIETYRKTRQTISGFECKKKLVDLKEKKPWLKEINSQSLQTAVLDLERAYIRFFRDIAEFPRFKNKYSKKSFAVPQYFKIIDSKIRIPKFKSGIKCIFHRPIEGIPKSLTISKMPSGKYFAAFICEFDTRFSSKTDNEIGIDLGLSSFITCSNGETIKHPKNFRKAEKRLKRLQRGLSAKQNGSKNRNKARLQFAIQHEKVNNRRNDFLHKLSRRIVNENQVICLETLNVKSMLQNHRLAKSIADSGWGEFVQQIKYKAEDEKRIVKQIKQFYPSSKICNVCGFKLPELKLSTREWICSNCNSIHGRDENASKVILNVGRDTPEITPVERRTAALAILSMKQVALKKQETLAS